MRKQYWHQNPGSKPLPQPPGAIFRFFFGDFWPTTLKKSYLFVGISYGLGDRCAGQLGPPATIIVQILWVSDQTTQRYTQKIKNFAYFFYQNFFEIFIKKPKIKPLHPGLSVGLQNKVRRVFLPKGFLKIRIYLFYFRILLKMVKKRPFLHFQLKTQVFGSELINFDAALQRARFSTFFMPVLKGYFRLRVEKHQKIAKNLRFFAFFVSLSLKKRNFIDQKLKISMHNCSACSFQHFFCHYQTITLHLESKNIKKSQKNAIFLHFI